MPSQLKRLFASLLAGAVIVSVPVLSFVIVVGLNTGTVSDFLAMFLFVNVAIAFSATVLILLTTLAVLAFSLLRDFFSPLI